MGIAERLNRYGMEGCGRDPEPGAIDSVRRLPYQSSFFVARQSHSDLLLSFPLICSCYFLDLPKRTAELAQLTHSLERRRCEME